jgi:hypothetical protein
MSISAPYPDMTTARLGTGLVDGVFGFATIMLLFYFSNLFGNVFPYATVIIITAVVFITSIITNSIFASISDCPIEGGKLSLNALYPAVPAGIVTLLFFIIEPYIGLFAFPFNTIKIPYSFTSSFKVASIFGLAFAIFWTIAYGQILATAKSESCN